MGDKIMLKLKLRIVLCAMLLISSNVIFAIESPQTTTAESAQGASIEGETSSSFSVTPIRIEFNSPGKIVTLNVFNNSTAPLYAQANLLQYLQHNKGGLLLDDSAPLSEAPAVIVTPVILQKVPGNKKQIMRILAIKQDPEKEYAYRLVIKSLAPTSLTKSAAAFSIGYSIPVFVLPANIHETYKIDYLSVDNKHYLKVSNTGNVHIAFSSIAITLGDKNMKLKGSGARVFPGNYNIIEVPKNIAVQLHGQPINLNITKSTPSDWEKPITESMTVSMS